MHSDGRSADYRFTGWPSPLDPSMPGPLLSPFVQILRGPMVCLSCYKNMTVPQVSISSGGTLVCIFRSALFSAGSFLPSSLLLSELSGADGFPFLWQTFATAASSDGVSARVSLHSFWEMPSRSSVFSFVPMLCLPCGLPHSTSVSTVSELRVRAAGVILTICSCGRETSRRARGEMGPFYHTSRNDGAARGTRFVKRRTSTLPHPRCHLPRPYRIARNPSIHTGSAWRL